MHTTLSKTKQDGGLKLRAAIFVLLIAAVPTIPAQAAATQTTAYALPAGSVVTVRLVDGVDPKRSPAGAEFAATVYAPVIDGDRVVWRAGTPASVRLVQDNGKGRRRTESRIELVSIGADQARCAIETTPLRVHDLVPRNTARSGLGKGAFSGAIAGGLVAGRIGIALGAGAGALAGEAIHAMRSRHDRLPPETQVDFMVIAPVVLK
jgi:hypothetical protein